MSVHTIFNANLVKALRDVVNPVGMGFMMPDYQRPYKWSEENIERLIDDIVGGLGRSNLQEVETLFLGTLIVVQAQNSEFTKYSQDSRKYASPTAIYYVVDGQQRLSTLAILAIVLHREITKLMKQLDTKYNSDSEYNVVKNLIQTDILDILTEFYSVSFSGSANPRLKPLILRKTQEFWAREGSQEYTSPIGRYIADYIQNGVEKDYSNDGSMYEILQTNQSKIYLELSGKLLDESNYFNLFDSAKSIFPDNFFQDFRFVLDENRLKNDSHILHLLKYCLFTMFMCKHCCVNYLEPKTHQWAIEVFQSLNSTGVPLSALEVFKAYVHQNTQVVNTYRDLVTEVFSTIEDQLINVNDDSAQHRTDVFLTAFALGFDGYKLGSRYTQQNKYLQKTFDDYIKSDFVTRVKQLLDKSARQNIPMFEYMLHLSKYMHFLSKPDSSFVSNSQIKVQRAYINLLFMKMMNFSTTHPLLAYFYQEDNSCDSDFLDACNATAAFYALWRSARSSSKLDNVARDLMLHGLRTDDGNFVVMNWKQRNKRVSIQQYKQALKNVLIREDLWDKDKWMSNATQYLTYQNSATLCRYILFLSHHNTIVHQSMPGLFQIGVEGTADFFNGNRWSSANYNSVEHIAPQKITSDDQSWSTDIYSSSEGNIVHSIGNLTLLPKIMNSIVSNLSWQYKHKFYTYLANPSTDRRNELLKLETDQVVKYTKPAKAILSATDLYFHHLSSIVQVPAEDTAWTREIIEKRTEFICSLAYDRLTQWLQD